MSFEERSFTPFSGSKTDNATKFHFQDVPKRQRHSQYDKGRNVIDQWRRFHGYNTGVWNGFWADNDVLPI